MCLHNCVAAEHQPGKNHRHVSEPYVNSITIPISGWSVWGAGYSSDPPDIRHIDPLMRRRMSSMDRSALHVADACVTADQQVRVVFASRHGELKRTTGLLEDIARGELPSPMGFSLSVLNAVPGLYGIARKDMSPATAVSAGEATLPLALIEASMQAWRYPDATVLLVYADEPPPSVYTDQIDSPASACAIALRLEARRATRMLCCSWKPIASCAVKDDAIHSLVNCLTHDAPTEWAGPDHLWRWHRE